MAFIAGRYNVKYDVGGTPFYIGQLDGLHLNYSFSAADIRGDSYGDTWQDGVYRGGNCQLRFTLTKYSAPNLAKVFWPFNATFGKVGTLGVLASSLAKQITLEAADGTPAESTDIGGGAIGWPRIITANYAILTPGHVAEFDLTPSLRVIPIELTLLPWDDTGTIRWFTSATSGSTTDPAAVGGFIAGPYTVTYDGVSVGQTNGIRLGWRMHAQPITGDAYGDSIQDFVYRGGDVWVSMVLNEYTAAAGRKAFWPYYTTGAAETDVGIMSNAASPIGRLLSGLAKPLVLTPVANTPAASAGHTFTIDKAILSPGTPIQLLYEHALGTVPLRFNCVPQGAIGSEEWFVPS